ncbi:MAG: hypothetical protein GX045_08250 [Clostridiaceae bacterium]|jgi:hypothetical protein|nr:hypothetical protein [Clostridiaceae bacterium]
MSNNRQSSTKKNTEMIIALSMAVVVTLLILGIYLWKSGNNNPSGDDSNITPTPTNAITTSVTPTPTEAPALTSTPTPSPTPSPTPAPTPMARLDFEPVKALYLNSSSVQKNELLEHYIDMANRTEINAYVIDIKNDDGSLTYRSEIPDVIAAKAHSENVDIRKIIKKFHDNNIRVIGRVVTFKDTRITKYKPELAIKYKGEIFKQPDSGRRTSHWLDPTNKGSWDYIVSILEEAVNFGFDEIQFDYIRFPETSLYDYDLELEEGKERRDYIEDFIAYVRQKLPDDVILSADIFGMPLISRNDYGEIGQTLETIGWNLDYISAMIYPSHFANSAPRGAMSNGVGQTISGKKFTHPDLMPYEVVYNTLIAGKKRIEAVEGYQLKSRPYLQGFTAIYLPDGYWKAYGVDEYRAQIQAVYDAGYEEWIFWNASNTYVEEAFLPED